MEAVYASDTLVLFTNSHDLLEAVIFTAAIIYRPVNNAS
jgi:hypothetical protein